MDVPTASDRLTAVLHAAQYLSNLTPQQDPWAELARTLRSFFQCDLVLIVRPDAEGEPRLAHQFSWGIPAGGILERVRDEVRAVLETGFLGAQTLDAPACALAFLPLPRDRRTAAVAIVGHGGGTPFATEELEILLALGGLFGNVIARVETEAELRDHQQTLEGLVARRTAELEKTNARLVRESADRYRAETELTATVELLRQADRHKNEFMAVLSHELRNPLAAIANSMRLLDQAVPGSEPARLAQAVIGRQAGQLSRLVDDLLDMTRVTRNKVQLQCQRLDLVRLARAAVADHRASFEGDGVGLALAAPEEPVWVFADPARVSQMVGNLLINAGKFTNRGGRVTVEVQARGPEAGVAVTDTGIGMDARLLGRLFQPFQQADRSLDRSRGGLGLGLALAKGLARLHGGDLTASSAGMGQGSRFLLTLPAAEPVPDRPGAAAPASPSPVRTRRILVIEDNLDAALTLKMLLEFHGHQVFTAHSGRDGVAKVKACSPEVVFCDIGLPDTDGYSVARTLRDDPQHRPLFLVAMTGYGRDEDKRRALEAGFDRHLTKPADIEALQQLLAF